jgi:type II secretory pathway pseudopilin PulG
MINNYKKSKGFTLVEIMVATSVFMVIMLVAMGALISSSDTAKKSQALRSAMDNLNFAMESMTRSLRMGTGYTCVTFGSSVSVPMDPGLPYVDCPLSGAGGGAVVFTPADNPVGSHPSGSRDTAYRLISSGGKGVLQRCNPACSDMMSSDVDVQQLTFYVNGSSVTDAIQPSVYILIKGVVNIKGVPNVFALQTMTSQRSAE